MHGGAHGASAADSSCHPTAIASSSVAVSAARHAEHGETKNRARTEDHRMSRKKRDTSNGCGGRSDDEDGNDDEDDEIVASETLSAAEDDIVELGGASREAFSAAAAVADDTAGAWPVVPSPLLPFA